MDRYARSAQLHAQSRQTLAGGVHSSMRARGQRVHFFERAEGAYLHDVDGNRFIDYWLGAGPLILGHSPQDVVAAIKNQLDCGLQTASETRLGAEVAARFVELVPCADLVHFANTGSEAVHVALRIARAWRNRERIVCFEGHFHGWFDNVWIDGLARGEPKPASDGQGGAQEDLIVLPWNDAEALSKAVADHAGQIACVIMNPMMLAGAPGGTMPRPGYLEQVRRICTEHQIVFILDEVLTGFRVALGGAQELFGVRPDLATYAKAIAAGVAHGAVAGARPFMDLVASGRVKHPGTYNGNVMAMAAAKAALEHFAADDGGFYRHCNTVREQLTERVLSSAARHNIPVNVRGAGAVMTIWFGERTDYHDARTADACHHPDRSARFFEGLLSRGVLANPTMYLSDAHTQGDVDVTLEAMDDVMAQL